MLDVRVLNTVALRSVRELFRRYYFTGRILVESLSSRHFVGHFKFCAQIGVCDLCMCLLLAAEAVSNDKRSAFLWGTLRVHGVSGVGWRGEEGSGLEFKYLYNSNEVMTKNIL